MLAWDALEKVKNCLNKKVSFAKKTFSKNVGTITQCLAQQDKSLFTLK